MENILKETVGAPKGMEGASKDMESSLNDIQISSDDMYMSSVAGVGARLQESATRLRREVTGAGYVGCQKEGMEYRGRANTTAH